VSAAARVLRAMAVVPQRGRQADRPVTGSTSGRLFEAPAAADVIHWIKSIAIDRGIGRHAAALSRDLPWAITADHSRAF